MKCLVFCMLIVTLSTLHAVQVTIENNTSTVISIFAKENFALTLKHINKNTLQHIEVDNIEKTIEFIEQNYQDVAVTQDRKNCKLILNECDYSD